MQEFSYELTRSTGKNKYLNKGNQVLNANDSLHHHARGNIVKYLRTLAKETAEYTDVYNLDNKCDILVVVHPPSARRFDPPNLYPTVKALIDGLTDAGVWTDDNSTVIRSMNFVGGEKTDNKKYLIKILVKSTIEGGFDNEQLENLRYITSE